MSFNQWKLLNIVKEALAKITSDKSSLNTSEWTKEFINTFQKISLPDKHINKIVQISSNSEKTQSNNEIKSSKFLPELKIPYKSEQKSHIPKWRDKKISDVSI